MAPEAKDLIYTKTSKGGITLNLYAVKGSRDYSSYVDSLGEQIIVNDKLFLLEIVDREGNKSASYPYYTSDIAECAYNVISNKIIRAARQKEADKIIARIQDSLNAKP